MRVFVQSQQPWMPVTVTGIYTVFGVNGDAVSRSECSKHYQTKVSNLNRIINCDPKVIQTRLNLLALID